MAKNAQVTSDARYTQYSYSLDVRHTDWLALANDNSPRVPLSWCILPADGHALHSIQPQSHISQANTSMATFHSFPELPGELRTLIYLNALPARMLQLGVNFPFPFIGKMPASNASDTSCYPVPTTLPALFSTTHESREVCRSIYVPFAYTYVHPRLDTLYISQSASFLLYWNIVAYQKCARPPLYPLAMLDRIVVEVRGDLGGSVGIDGYHTIKALAWFGPPRELLVIQGKPGEPGYCISPLRGWTSITLLENEMIEVAAGEAARDRFESDLVEMQRNASRDVAWIKWRQPKVMSVEVVKQGEIFVSKRQLMGKKRAGERVAREWRELEYAIKGREWNWELDDRPYCLPNLTNALTKAGVIWRWR